jgi:two-component sensor histidine kinase
VWLLANRRTDSDGEEMLDVTIADDGVGLPPGNHPEGLGLQIVRTLVTSELGGTIQWSAREGGGTAVRIEMGLSNDQGS